MRGGKEGEKIEVDNRKNGCCCCCCRTGQLATGRNDGERERELVSLCWALKHSRYTNQLDYIAPNLSMINDRYTEPCNRTARSRNFSTD